MTQPEYGWKNHPASKMWKGYERALTFYGYVICDEWIKRGYKDSMIERFIKANEFETSKGPYINPHFIDNNDFHISHQSNLLRKDLEYYRKYFPDVPDNLPYIWPIESTDQ